MVHECLDREDYHSQKMQSLTDDQSRNTRTEAGRRELVQVLRKMNTMLPIDEDDGSICKELRPIGCSHHG